MHNVQSKALNLPDAVADAVLQDALERSLHIIEVEEKTWSDGCLGLARSGEICTQAIVPGYKVTVEVAGLKLLIYRTNKSGSQVKLEKEAPLE